MARLVRWIWRLYPPAFRKRFVPEMERDLELRIEAGRGVGLGLVVEALLTLVRAWTRFTVRPVTLEGLVTDMAVALRSLRRAPGYAVAVVSILALALGANTAVFSVTHAVLLRALPYGAPERVYRIQPAPIGRVSPDQRGWAVDPEATALPQLEAAALYIENGGANLTTADATERISVTQVSDDFFRVPEGVAEEDVPWATWIQVTPDYFDAMGIGTVAGRAFAEPGLGEYDQVAISETLARTLYGEAHPTGAAADLHVGREAVPTVVAAVMDGVHMRTRQATPPEVVYTLLDESRYLSFALRADGDPLLLAERVREVMRTTDPSVPIFDLTTTGQAAASEIATERAVALLSRLFSACALILAAVGLYGLVSQALTRRRRELGIRLVMGARPGSLVRAAMGRPIGLALAGLAAGLLISLWASRYLAPLLFEVPTRDPTALAAVCATIIGTTALAAYLPARRAARVDPGESLRAE